MVWMATRRSARRTDDVPATRDVCGATAHGSGGRWRCIGGGVTRRGLWVTRCPRHAGVRAHAHARVEAAIRVNARFFSKIRAKHYGGIVGRCSAPRAERRGRRASWGSRAFRPIALRDDGAKPSLPDTFERPKSYQHRRGSPTRPTLRIQRGRARPKWLRPCTLGLDRARLHLAGAHRGLRACVADRLLDVSVRL